MPTRTWTGAVNGNWNNNGNWVEGAFATSADDVVMGTITTAMTVNVASACLSIDFTGYGSRALTMFNTLTCTGNFKMISTMTISGSSALIMAATATLTSAGVTWSAPLQLTTAATYTLADDWNVSANFTYGSLGVATTMNGHNMNLSGNFTMNANGGTIAGTTNIVITNTCTFTLLGTLGNNVEVNASGKTITFSGATLAFANATFKWTAGSIASAPAINGWIGTTTTFDTSLVTWGALNLSTGTSGRVLTLTSNLNVTNVAFNLTVSSGTSSVNGANINCSGNLTMLGNAGAQLIGTGKLVFNGSGTQAWSNGNIVAINVDINKPSGTLTINTTTSFRTGTLTWIAGTVTTVGTQNFGTGTYNTAGITWQNISLVSGAVITNNSLMTIVTTLTLSGSNQLIGTAGITTLNLTGPGANNTITFGATNTYTVNGTLTLNGTAANNLMMVSSSPGSQYNLILTNNATATQAVSFVNVTDCNSNTGLTIYDYKGTLSNTNNWKVLTSWKTRSSGRS